MNKIIVPVLIFILLFSCKTEDKKNYNMKKMTNLNDNSKVNLKTNDLAYYTFAQHGSVGITAEYSIEDESIIACIDTKIVYRYPERMKQGMPGADSAAGTFIFRALKPGKTVITVNHMFRGKIENSVSIEVVIE